MGAAETKETDANFKKQYEKNRVIGRGQFGMVWKCTNRKTKQIVAVKEMHTITEDDMKDVTNEKLILQQMDSPYIIKLIDHFDNKTENCYRLVLEYCNMGSLDRVFRDKGTLEDDELLTMAFQCVTALDYMHSRGVVHRDIKPANILCHQDENGVVIYKLGDLGCSKHVQQSITNSVLGTPNFWAPEVVHGNKHYASKIDIWSLGATIYYLAEGLPPFPDMRRLKNEEIRMLGPPIFKKNNSVVVKDTVHHSLVVDPNERSSAAKLLTVLEEWYSEYLETTQQGRSLSDIEPNEYISYLAETRKLLPSHPELDQSFRQTFKQYGSSITCCVFPNSRTIPYENFESTHFLYFEYTKYESNYSAQKRFVYHLLHITHRQLSAIDKFIKQNNIHNELFAEPMSKALPETIKKRNHLQKVYEYEEILMIKPTLPRGQSNAIFNKHKYMTPHDLPLYSHYLQVLFSSPSLLLKDAFYEIMGISDHEIITLFKCLALSKLQSLKSVALTYDHSRSLRDPTRLSKKIGVRFHTLWIVKRPLNDENGSFLGFYHWALKFEGNNELMTIGFFAYNENHGVILTQIAPNTPLNRRLFWHYWPRDNISEIKPEHFNTKWTVLEKVYLSKMDCPLIGELIVEWLSYDNHAVYDLNHNNCQHFVRDFVAPLDSKMAKRLNLLLDVTIVKRMLPAALIAENIDSQARRLMMNNKLCSIIERYQEESKQQMEKKKNENEHDFVMRNFDDLANVLKLSFSSSEDDDVLLDENDNEMGVIDDVNNVNNESLEKDHDSLKIYNDKIALNKIDDIT